MTRRRLVRVALGAAATTLAVVAALWLWLGQALTPTISLQRYQATLAEARYLAPLTGHFPPQIPPGARDVSLVYQRGLRAEHLQLRMRLPATEVAGLAREAEVRAVRVLAAGEPDTLAVPELIAGVAGAQPFPPGFTRYIFIGSAGLSDGEGMRSGVAIKPATGELVYWAERWSS